MAPVPRNVAASRCNCQAVRQAARRISALYDQHLAPLGLRLAQYAVLQALKRGGPTTIQVLADRLEMDRTTLARNLRPLERDGLLATAPHREDRRARYISLTAAGQERMARARPAWDAAQVAFELSYGAERAARLRDDLAGVVAVMHRPS